MTPCGSGNMSWLTFPLQTLSDGDQIVIVLKHDQQYLRVEGSNGETEVSPTPFGTELEPLLDGALFSIVSFSSDNPIKLVKSDIDYGMILNGDVVLKKGEIQNIRWDALLKRFLDAGRNKR